MGTDAAPRYEQLAAVFASKIDKGQFAPGARMPSVRSVSEQHGTSTSTALQAYRLLQERDILVARPQAGSTSPRRVPQVPRQHPRCIATSSSPTSSSA